MTDTNLRVTIIAEQPLALGIASEVSFFTDSHPFIPGPVLRGALAAAWIADHGPPERDTPHIDRFRELFDGDIRYGPLLPEGSQREPLSVLHCKYPTTDACQAIAVDLAFEHQACCPGCRQGFEPSKGALALPPALALHRRVRTSINPKTSRAKDGELYATAAIPPETKLVGSIHGTHPWLSEPRNLWLGGRRSVGGAATYQAEPFPAESLASEDIADVLVIRLVSPAILVDTGGRPRLDPDPILDLPGVTLDRAWTRPATWEGWHAASRLPKPMEICAAAGSTYRITGDHDDLVQLGTRLLHDGIGLRRAEGFGVVDIALGPWRREIPDLTVPGIVDTTIHERLRKLHKLKLAKPERRWLIGALRGLQLEIQRPTSYNDDQPGTLDAVLDELLAQPMAATLSGRQRDDIRSAVANLSPDQLRDLTTLAIANLDTAQPATSGTGDEE